ncbi:MAG: CRISPR-associated helicase Cas3' [Nitrospira sp.]|nr:CRISPR-associated helicase Cas3' [Nitrospira sp.]MDI3462624.1 CRISPR-associated helicase Cas3 [Nitrospira sp.]
MSSEPTLDTESYKTFFRRVTGCHDPFDYQLHIAQQLFQGRNIVLRAPTGAGKTWAVLTPFLSTDGWAARPARLIYVLPLRTLAQGIYREAREAASRLGHPVESVVNARGQETVSPFVTLQTGEQPDDRFFDRGKIIVTTYDQLLSGLLDGPYGLSDRLHNINAAAVAGSLVVFDEFHLMEPHRAFLTAAACLYLFRNLCQSVWMTATATRPLEKVLHDALDTVSIPATEGEAVECVKSLPSVTEVTRHIIPEHEPLSAQSVLRCHEGRSIVLLNTVGRAQEMFQQLREKKKPETCLMLLHSRFFKEDRRAKEKVLRSLFGKGAKGDAMLVSTQVVEAGLDLSCEHLHTELCPMNALVQRGGRCARFAGETGTVHVYPFPQKDKAWLPYGDQHREDIALTRTRALLQRIGHATLQPHEAAAWVQEVHGAEDEQALREGWRTQLNKCLGLIQQNAILREPRRVADFIRGEDTDSIRVIISEEVSRPESPGQREGLSLSRRSLYGLFQNRTSDVGWYWDGSDEEPWKTLGSVVSLNRTYVVCLRPSVAAYDKDIGLRIGIPGNEISPDRMEPPRPGYAPLRMEPWTAHAQQVAKETRRRLEKDGWTTGLLGVGFAKRYVLDPPMIMDAAQACALLHDLGKLQNDWQRWAEAAQRSRDSSYEHKIPLAHTDFDPEKPEDRARERTLGFHRPMHAPASAYYGRAFIVQLLRSVTDGQRAYVASACIAAILAHHGGWWPKDLEHNPPPLWLGWETAVAHTLGCMMDTKILSSLRNYPVEKFLKAATGADSLSDWWPLVAYLTRTLRLSDQRATAEGTCHG